MKPRRPLVEIANLVSVYDKPAVITVQRRGDSIALTTAIDGKVPEVELPAEPEEWGDTLQGMVAGAVKQLNLALERETDREYPVFDISAMPLDVEPAVVDG